MQHVRARAFAPPPWQSLAAPALWKAALSPARATPKNAQVVEPLVETIEALVAPGGAFLYVAPESNRQGEVEFLAALCKAGYECQESAVPEHYLGNVLADCSDEDFDLLFGELRQRTYTLYCFTRVGTLPLPAPPTSSPSSNSLPVAAASTGTEPPPPAVGGLPQSFVDSALSTKTEYEASLRLPHDERAALERAAATRRRPH